MVHASRLLACLIWLVPLGCVWSPTRPQTTAIDLAVVSPAPPDLPRIGTRNQPPSTTDSAPGWQPTRLVVAGEQDPLAQTPPLTLKRLQQLALQHNPTLDIARAGIDAAAGRQIHAARPPNPIVGYVANEIGADGGAGQQGVFYQVQLLRGEKRQLSLEVGRLGIEQARRIAAARQQQVLNDVALATIDVQSAQQALAVATQLETLAQQGLKTAEQQVELEQADQPDVLQSRIEFNQSRLLREKAGHRVAAARRRLAAVIGLPRLPEGTLPGPLGAEPGPIDWGEATKRIHAQSPLLAAARTNLARSRSVLARAEAEPTPNLQIQTALQHDAGSRDILGTLQLGWAVPSRYGNEGRIAQAVADIAGARREIDRLTLTIAVRLARLRQRHDDARMQFQRQKENLVTAEQNLELTNIGYQKQEYAFVRVLTARRTLAEIRVARLSALTELHRIAVEINGLLLRGALDPVAD